jgi:hypothetical protein
MRDFIGYKSLHCAYKHQHFGYTFTDVFTECDMKLLEQLFVMDSS